MREKIKTYETSVGVKIEINISKKACHKFGYYPGDRVFIPFDYDREATVVGVGVINGNLWFLIDGRPGIMHADYRSKKEFEKHGITLVKRASEATLQ